MEESSEGGGQLSEVAGEAGFTIKNIPEKIARFEAELD